MPQVERKAQVITAQTWERKFKPLFCAPHLEAKVQTSSGKLRYDNLDNAATTKPFAAVMEEIEQVMRFYGSVHRGSGQHSQITTARYELARERVAHALGATGRHHLLFTANTTGSVNQLAMLYGGLPGTVLVSDIEHSSNLLPWRAHNKVIQYRTSETGEVDLDNVEAALRRQAAGGKSTRVKVLALTAASNVIAYQPPLRELARLAHTYDATIAIDACQYVQHSRLDVGSLDSPTHLDFVSCSGHKMYAPFGAGVLLGPAAFFDRMPPPIIGGGNIAYITSDGETIRRPGARTHEAGTPNALGAIAIDRAFQELARVGFGAIEEYEQALTDRLRHGLSSIREVSVLGPNEAGSVVPFVIHGQDAREVAGKLANHFGIGVRAGTFCTYELLRKLLHIDAEQDLVIAAAVRRGELGHTPAVIRASISIWNRPEDIDRLIEAVRKLCPGRRRRERSALAQESFGEQLRQASV